MGLQIGLNTRANGGARRVPLVLPPLEPYAQPLLAPGGATGSATHRLGEWLAGVFAANAAQANFRLFSPDETSSNKLDAVFAQTAKRAEFVRVFFPPDANTLLCVMERALAAPAR